MKRFWLSPEEREYQRISRETEKQLKKQNKEHKSKINLLLLGIGESGKSTFIKQMRMINGNGYRDDDRRSFTQLAFQNIITAIMDLIYAMRTLRIDYIDDQNAVPLGMDLASQSKMTSEGDDSRPVPPTSLPLQGGPSQRKKLSAPRISLSLDHSEDDLGETPDDLDINVDELDTPDEGDYLDYTDHEMDWEDPGAATRSGTTDSYNTIPTYSAEEERRDVKLWRTVIIGEQEHRINMKVIEPYMKVISHGGYYSSGVNAIIVFAACFLPDSVREDYHEIMENLFLYVISTLELMVAEDYMIVYLNGATPHRRMPGLGWLKKCYQMIDRRLRKNLKSFIIVHPSWFIRTVLAITKPFISTKFSSKIKYVSSLDELQELIPMDSIQIPECIIKLDKELKEAAENSKMNSFLQGTELSAASRPDRQDQAGASSS